MGNVFQKNNVNDLVATNVSVLPNTLKFNDDDMLVAEITCIASAGQVWCCQRDTAESQAFCNMVQELEQYYNTSSINEKAKTIQIGGHYVALYEQMWCRVRVFEVDGDNIHCFCIDFGDEWIAFVCRLAGVEELYEVSKTSERLQTFLGKVVAVQPDANSDDSETDRNDPVISVVLYDLETGAPINEQIITLMSIEMALPSLTINTPTEVHVTHALDNGEVYVQIRSKGFDYLMSLIEKAGSNIVSNKSNVLPVLVSKTNSTGMFFIQSKDNLWYRVQILDWSPFNEKLAQIFYIDTGKSEVINIKDTLFYSLDEISDVISKFPPQGYLVRVSLKTVPGDFVNQIENLMPSDTAVLVKSLRVDDDYVSVVEFFKRSESDNILFSMNMLISADNTQNGSGDGNNNHNCKTQSKKLQKLMSLNHFEDVSKNVPSTGSLTCPTLPELGNYFDVKIPCAVHPYNFFVFQKNNVNDLVATNVSVLPNTLKFNDDDMLVAEITCIASAGEVWCCQRDTAESQAFCNMVQELEQYYNTSSINEKAKTIQIGGHYVALYEQMWCRVRVFEVDGDNIHCFCIDFGDEWIVQKNFLFNLNKKFANEQAQAFVCRLAGVEELYEVSKTSERLQTFLGKVVAVQPDANSDDSETDRNDPAISVVLYDLETGAPINEQIITLMSIEMALPSLTINTPTEVHVTHALDNGEVYVQIRSKGFDYLMSLIEKAGSNIVSNKSNVLPVLVSKTNSTGMFFIQSKDNLWYRVQILDWSPFSEKLAQILYIDTGKSEVINIKDTLFYSLDEISDVISKFPPQGYLVRVSLKTVPGDFVNQIENLMPSDTAVLVKSLRVDDDYVSVVEFFKRSESDNILFSVNMLISADNTQNGSGDGNNNHNCKTQSKKLQKLMSLNHFEDVSKNVPSTGSLTCPTLPELGNYFDVKIPCAVHPYNFFVQPYESQSRLNKLMVMLQERYKDVQYSPIQITDICPGKIYASRHKDGKWYRTSVIKVIHSGSISVFYCDFGYYGNLSVHDLVPLDDDFMDLPYQAIKAKLADVQPKNSNWSMDDCEYFTNLVCKKPFVSILKGIEKDVLYRSDTILLLKLIDTSTSTDVHIDQLLIDRGIAISYPQ